MDAHTDLPYSLVETLYIRDDISPIIMYCVDGLDSREIMKDARNGCRSTLGQHLERTTIKPMKPEYNCQGADATFQASRAAEHDVSVMHQFQDQYGL